MRVWGWVHTDVAKIYNGVSRTGDSEQPVAYSIMKTDGGGQHSSFRKHWALAVIVVKVSTAKLVTEVSDSCPHHVFRSLHTA